MKRKAISMVLAVMFLSSCAGMSSAPVTPQSKYYAALKFFNDTVEQYQAYYMAASPETKAKWKAEINPIIKQASAALDLWADAIGTYGAEASETKWLTMKTNLIAALIHYGMIKEGGK